MGRWDRDARDRSNRNSRKSCSAPGRKDQSLSPIVLTLPSPSALQQCHRPRRALVTYTPSRPLVVVEGEPRAAAPTQVGWACRPRRPPSQCGVGVGRRKLPYFSPTPLGGPAPAMPQVLVRSKWLEGGE
jgi:hypothetical protein